MDTCKVVAGVDSINDSFWEQTTCIPAAMFLQIGLFFHTIYFQYSKREMTQFQQISLRARVLFITLQLIGLWWVIMDLFRFVIDPLTNILKGNFICHIAAFTPKLVPGTYYLIYLYQILLRLESSFKESYLELSKITIYILMILIFVPIVTAQIAFFVLILNESNYSTCIAEWEPVDLSSKIAYCELPISDKAFDIVLIMSLWIPIINLIFAIIFSVKLNTLLSDNVDNEHIKFKFKSLIIKNCIMTVVGVISTMLCYTLWTISPRGIFLYSDLFINCMVIGLMFKYNEKHYKRCCKCCILICFLQCDKSKRKTTEQDVLQYVNDEIDLSSIFNPNINSTSKEKITTPTASHNSHFIGSIEEIVSNVDDNIHNIDLDVLDSHMVNDHAFDERDTPRTKRTITPYQTPIKIVELNSQY